MLGFDLGIINYVIMKAKAYSHWIQLNYIIIHGLSSPILIHETRVDRKQAYTEAPRSHSQSINCEQR